MKRKPPKLVKMRLVHPINRGEPTNKKQKNNPFITRLDVDRWRGDLVQPVVGLFNL